MMKSAVFAVVLAAATALFAGCASSSGARSEPSTTSTNAAAPEPEASPQATTQGPGMMGGQGQGMDGGQGMGRMGRQRQAMSGQGMGMMGAGMCPMQVPGTTVTATDVEGGVALDFMTTGDVAELRQRVQRMQATHEHRAGGGMMMGSATPPGSGTQPGQGETAAAPSQAQSGVQGGGVRGGGMMMPPATAAVEDIDGGARLVLRPKDPSQLATLRDHVRMRATRMAGGQCPMMSGSQAATPPPPATDDADHRAHHPSS